MDFKCLKCGSKLYEVKNVILPEKSIGLKLELSLYYVKNCLNCGYSEFYKAKIVDKDVEKNVEKNEEPKKAY